MVGRGSGRNDGSPRPSGQVTMYRADETSIKRGNVNMYAVLDNDPTRNGTSDPFSQ